MKTKTNPNVIIPEPSFVYNEDQSGFNNDLSKFFKEERILRTERKITYLAEAEKEYQALKNGEALQSRINQAKKNDIIKLDSVVYKF